MDVLITGATGYIGGKLVPRMLAAGHRVRVFVRSPEKLKDRDWAPEVTVFIGDLEDEKSIAPAMDGVDAAYFLVHSMAAGSGFAEKDRKAANAFARAANEVSRVYYLGGLQPKEDVGSKHLRSRAEVGEILREGCSATEFRAGPIIGVGSASFDIVRYLDDRLPVMILPRWVRTPVQPIGIDDILEYLARAVDRDTPPIVEVGAPQLTFKEMIEVYAEERGLYRVTLPIPALTPWLSAQWIGWVTPVSNTMAVPLVQGMIAPLLVRDPTPARDTFPEIDPATYRETVQKALAELGVKAA